MNYPSLNNNKRYSVNITSLNGGINTAELPSQIEDNQAVEISNMWFKDGSLQTRPGMQKIGTVEQTTNFIYTMQEPIQSSEYGNCIFNFGNVDDNGSTYITFINIENGQSFNIYDYIFGEEENPIKEFTSAVFFTDGTLSYYNETYERTDTITNIRGFLTGTLTDGTLKNYLFSMGLSSDGIVFQLNELGAPVGWDEYEYEQVYVPTTVINKNPDGTGGNQLEAFNMLTGGFIEKFNTTSTDTIYYTTLKELTTNTNIIIWISYLHTDGQTYTWGIDSESNTSMSTQTINGNNISVTVDRTLGKFTFSHALYKVTGIQNNLSIQAYKTDQDAIDKMAKMTKAIWFGGERSGIAGGTRLFLTGNPDEPNLIYWSDLNNPLYFPEDNYNNIGEKSKNITALNKQDEYLIVFKENEIYSISYNTETTSKVQTNLDGTTTTTPIVNVYFPTTPLSPNIGCDAPNTIQIINDRLVWAHSNGNVYMMISPNYPYSEQPIKEISRNIKNNLKQDFNIKNACSCDYQGCYLLCDRRQVYIWDYDSISYINYSSSEKSEKRLTWYFWNLASDINILFSYNEKLYGINFLSIDTGLNRELWAFGDSFDVVEDISTPIVSLYKSKMWNFKNPQSYKKIIQMHLNLKSSKLSKINVSFSNERGELPRTTSINQSLNLDSESQVFSIKPNINRSREISYSITSTGHIELIGTSIKVKELGEVK